ncbi:hypothetical protein K490DRAFT_59113 [Saccharata proteae CBS 121410]|uniref:Uncharacterized protein n=1 Tax=Saccharata proteae CBS 121410 TaxID=1314787 RepID=A0A9P4LUL4_9PEZI|nr:hypothetical protein K490DRAFT_59113 [Saccharata proteae CBS 121410]
MPGRPSLPPKAHSAATEDRDSRLRRFSSFTSFAQLTAPLNPFSRRERRQTANVSHDSVPDLPHTSSNMPVRSPRKATGSKIPSINIPSHKMAPPAKPAKSGLKKGAPLPRSQTMGNLPPLPQPRESPTQPRPRIFSPVRYYNPSKPANVAGNPLVTSHSTNNLLPPTRIPTPVYRKSQYGAAGHSVANASNAAKMSRSTTQPNLLEVPKEDDDDQDVTPRQTKFKEPLTRPPRVSSLSYKENSKPESLPKSKPPVLPRPVSFAPTNDWFSGEEEDYEHERQSFSSSDDTRPLWSSAKAPAKSKPLEAVPLESSPFIERPKTPAAGRKSSIASQSKLPRLNSLKDVKQESLLRPISPPMPKLQPMAFRYASGSSVSLLENAVINRQVQVEDEEEEEHDTSVNLMDNAAINGHFKDAPVEYDSSVNLMDNAAINRKFKVESESSANLLDNATVNRHSDEQSFRRASLSSTTSSELLLQLHHIHEPQELGWWGGRFATIRNRHLQENFTEDLALDPRSIYDEYMQGDEEGGGGFSGTLKDRVLETRQCLKVFDELRGLCMTEEARESLWDFEVDYFKDFFDRLRNGNLCRHEETGSMLSRRLIILQEWKVKFAHDNRMPGLLLTRPSGDGNNQSIGHPSIVRSNLQRQQPPTAPLPPPQQLPGTTERKPSLMEKLRKMTISKKSLTSLSKAQSNPYMN